MKANASKRKVFQDAVDLFAAPEEVVVVENSVQMIPVDKIVPFHNHPFRLYEGERLNDMVESIKEHGVLNPVIVLKTETGYEMLAGHNRWNAAKIAGVNEIPTIVKADLSEEEAYVYVIETNLMQRSFTDLLPSEKAAVLAERYEKVTCQGKRNDILREIALLEGKDAEVSCGHSDHKTKSRDALGSEYELSGSSVARLLRLNKLIPALKEMVDAQTLAFMVAVKLSNYSEGEQAVLAELAKQGNLKLNPKSVDMIASIAGEITSEKVMEILGADAKEKVPKAVNMKVPAEIYKKYFSGMKPNEAEAIVEKALEAWFQKGAAE